MLNKRNEGGGVGGVLGGGGGGVLWCESAGLNHWWMIRGTKGGDTEE